MKPLAEDGDRLATKADLVKSIDKATRRMLLAFAVMLAVATAISIWW